VAIERFAALHVALAASSGKPSLFAKKRKGCCTPVRVLKGCYADRVDLQPDMHLFMTFIQWFDRLPILAFNDPQLTREIQITVQQLPLLPDLQRKCFLEHALQRRCVLEHTSIAQDWKACPPSRSGPQAASCVLHRTQTQHVNV